MIDFFNDASVGSKFFAKGCPYCGSEIEFVSCEDAFGYAKRNYDHVYICSNRTCGAYTPAHKISKEDGIQHHPQGVIANEDLRRDHSMLNTIFAPFHQNNLISKVFHKYILSFTDEENDVTLYGEVVGVDNETKIYKIVTENGTLYEVPKDKTQKIKTRTRSYFWLATKLGIPMCECHIPQFNSDVTAKAISIIQEANQQINNHESNSKQCNSGDESENEQILSEGYLQRQSVR